jgi:hypothetical protein
MSSRVSANFTQTVPFVTYPFVADASKKFASLPYPRMARRNFTIIFFAVCRNSLYSEGSSKPSRVDSQEKRLATSGFTAAWHPRLFHEEGRLKRA